MILNGYNLTTGLMLHGRNIDIQVMAELKFPDKQMVKTKWNEQTIKRGAEQLLREYESLGHGRHFQATLPGRKNYDLTKNLNDKYGLNVTNITVLWTSHDFLFMILHEEVDFI